jgi:hypothetical protein
MNEKLQNKLFKKFPKLFARRKLDKTESCMYWGIDCGDGWYDLMYLLCSEVQEKADELGVNFCFEQVKEKFGALVIYMYRDEKTKDYNKYAHEILSKYKKLSLEVCEETGGKGQLCKSSFRNLKTLNLTVATLLGYRPVNGDLRSEDHLNNE